MMPVPGHTLGARTLIAFDEEKVGFNFAARAADTAERVGNDARRFNQTRLEQRYRRKQNARWITARRGNEGCFLDFGAVKFRQAVNSLSEQIRRRMFVPIKLFVNGGTFDPEISAQIDDTAAALKQRDGVFGRDAVRQSQEHDFVLASQHFRFGLTEPECPGARMMAELGKDFPEHLTGVLA